VWLLPKRRSLKNEHIMRKGRRREHTLARRWTPATAWPCRRSRRGVSVEASSARGRRRRGRAGVSYFSLRPACVLSSPFADNALHASHHIHDCHSSGTLDRGDALLQRKAAAPAWWDEWLSRSRSRRRSLKRLLDPQ
jgi:hypothetical protein